MTSMIKSRHGGCVYLRRCWWLSRICSVPSCQNEIYEEATSRREEMWESIKGERGDYSNAMRQITSSKKTFQHRTAEGLNSSNMVMCKCEDVLCLIICAYRFIYMCVFEFSSILTFKNPKIQRGRFASCSLKCNSFSFNLCTTEY